MMKLLQAHSLTATDAFVPESMALNLSERQSTATLTVGPGAPEISVGAWIQDDAEPGSGIVWRVKTVDTQFDTGTRTIQLEHLVNTLRDSLMFGEVKPSMMGGGTTCTAEQAVEYILGRQSDWTLGTFAYVVSNPYTFNGDDLMSALETVSSSLSDCWWSYDFSSYPFTLNITQRADTVGTELRLSRNIQTAKHTVDRTRMYTRLYPIGKNNLHIDGNYISRNENLYGIICKTETDQSKDSKAELQRWAEERIAKHCEPSVTVTVNALDLSDATGESLDALTLGAVCRMPVPGLPNPIQETITRISWPNKIAEPRRATVTLANAREDVASIVNSLMKSSGRGGRAGAKNAEEDHAWFVDTTDHVAMIAEGVAGEGASTDWSMVANLLVDGNGIHQRVTQAQGEIVEAFSAIESTSTAIMLEVNNVKSDLRSFILQTPEMIHAEVGSAVSGFAQSVIEQTATYIRTEVSNAASSITQSVVEQTAEWVQTEVASVASGVAWSVVTQTMTNIIQQVGAKARVYVQMTQPTGSINEGDIWVKSTGKRTWGDAAANSGKWSDASSFRWKDYAGSEMYVYKDNKWVLIGDNAEAAEQQVTIEQTKSSIDIIGHELDTQGQNYESKLQVTAQRIRGEVSTAKSALYSVVQQTATNVFSGVYNEVSDHFSTIEQTSESIAIGVNAAKSSLATVIQVTATGVFSGVYNKVSDNFSTIVQTSTSIAIGVNAAKSTLYTTIMATATGVFSGVYSKVGDNFSTIVQTSTNIAIGVNAAKSSMYTVIMATATGVYSNVYSRVGNNFSTITQTSSLIATRVGKGEVISSINQTAESITINASRINLSGYVKSTDLTSDYITTKLANFQSLTSERGGISVYSVGTTNFSQGGVSCYLPNAIWSLRIQQSGNTYTLQRQRYNDDGWTDVGSFSRATTLSGEWSGNTYTVTATPQGNTNSVSPQIHPVSSQGGAYFDTYIGTTNGSTWTNHGDAKRFTIDDSGLTVYVKDSNNWVYAQKMLSDSNLTAGNIRSGVTIFGTTGSYSGSGTVSGDDIDLNGSSSSTSSTKPTTAISKGVANFTGYIWHKKSDGTWENLRSFSISTGATHFTTPLYYYANGTYHQVTENRLMYYTT